jgi:formylglycine-generating enzyme required for sulfatase activity
MRELHQVFSALVPSPPDGRMWTVPAPPPQAPPWRPAGPRSRLIAIGAGALAGLAGIAGVLYATSEHNRASLIAPPTEAAIAPLDNAWVRIAVPAGRVPLGVARDDAPAAVRGFRPARQILSPAAPYEIQEHEVTWSEIEHWLIVNATRLVLPPWAADRAARRALPVTGATWSIARAYCESLGGSLPTEEQWEFAARGAERRPNSWGSDRLDRRLTPVYAGTSAVPAPVMTSLQDRTPPPVVYDLIGNVQEWTLGLWRTDQRSDDSWSTIGKSTTIRAIRGLPLGDDPPPSIQDETAAYREELCATGPCVARTAATLPLVGFRCARPAP